jgi:choice-of-anchor C domain-containing protein
VALWTPEEPRKQAWGWAYQILPYVDSQPFYYDVDDSTTAKYICGVYLCPSRRANRGSRLTSGAGQLLTNGSFESGPNPGGSFVQVNVGSTAITGWTVVNGAIDYKGYAYFDASNGSRSIDLHASPSMGGMEQIITTTPGSSYILTFDFGGNVGAPDLKSMQVNVGPFSQVYTMNTAGRSFQNMGWRTETVQFTATSSSTTLTFVSTGPASNKGPALDNVRLVELGKGNTMAERAITDYAASIHTVGTSTFPTDDICNLPEHYGVIVGIVNNTPVRLPDILDGASQTMILGEKALNIELLGMEVGDSDGWASGCNVNTVRTAQLQPVRTYQTPCGPTNSDTYGCSQGRFGAEHSTGFNTLFADGSVHLIRFSVDLANFSNLVHRKDGQAIDPITND